LRTARALGVGGVVLPRDRSVGVTPVVAAASAGLLFGLPVAQVPNLVRAMEALKAAGFWLVGLSPRGGTPPAHLEPPARPAVVAGKVLDAGARGTGGAARRCSSGVEQLTCNQQVVGSTPTIGSSRRVGTDAERYPSGQREQTVNLPANAYGGSNPPLSIRDAKDKADHEARE